MNEDLKHYLKIYGVIFAVLLWLSSVVTLAALTAACIPISLSFSIALGLFDFIWFVAGLTAIIYGVEEL